MMGRFWEMIGIYTWLPNIRRRMNCSHQLYACLELTCYSAKTGSLQQDFYIVKIHTTPYNRFHCFSWLYLAFFVVNILKSSFWYLHLEKYCPVWMTTMGNSVWSTLFWRRFTKYVFSDLQPSEISKWDTFLCSQKHSGEETTNCWFLFRELLFDK